MSDDEALRRARKIRRQTLGNPKNPNGQIIRARRGNSAKTFQAAGMLKLAKNAKKRVEHAQAAIDRFSR